MIAPVELPTNASHDQTRELHVNLLLTPFKNAEVPERVVGEQTWKMARWW